MSVPDNKIVLENLHIKSKPFVAPLIKNSPTLTASKALPIYLHTILIKWGSYS